MNLQFSNLGKENYYRALRKTQKTIRSNDPDWHPWILFFLKTLDNQVKRLRGKIEHEKILLHSMPALSTIIIDYIKNHGRVTLSEIVKISGANRNTMKKHFQSLVAKNQIYRHGKGRGVWYSLT